MMILVSLSKVTNEALLRCIGMHNRVMNTRSRSIAWFQNVCFRYASRVFTRWYFLLLLVPLKVFTSVARISKLSLSSTFASIKGKYQGLIEQAITIWSRFEHIFFALVCHPIVYNFALGVPKS